MQQTSTSLAISQEQIAQARSGKEGVVSKAGKLAMEMSGIQCAMGNSAPVIPTAQNFNRSLSSMPNVKATVKIFAEDVPQQNAALLERRERVVVQAHSDQIG